MLSIDAGSSKEKHSQAFDLPSIIGRELLVPGAAQVFQCAARAITMTSFLTSLGPIPPCRDVDCIESKL